MTGPTKTRAILPGTRPPGTDDQAAAARQVREMFSGIAPHYDLLNHLLSLRFDIAWRRRVARRFHTLLARPDAHVLDLCCGTGDLALALTAEAWHTKGSAHAEILGADFAHPMLVRAREKAGARSGGAAPEFVEADALALPFSDETFDLATAAFGLRNLADYRAGLAELHRILHRGGSLAILEFTEPRSALFGRLFGFYFHRVLPRVGGVISGNAGAYNYLPRSVGRFPPPRELARLIEEAGFREVSYERWTGGVVAFHTGRREGGNAGDLGDVRARSN